MWKERTDPARPSQRPNAHPASEYLLSGRLRALQDEGILVGTLSGPPNRKTAYYRHRRSKRGRRKGSIYNNLIPAKPLHDAIVAFLAEVLLDAPDLTARLARHLHEQRASTVLDDSDQAQLEAERDEVTQQILATVRSLKGAALADAEEELKRLSDRRNAIEARLAALRSQHTKELKPVDDVVSEALTVLAEDSRRLLTLPIEPLRELTTRLIADATVNMETKAVELKVVLPTWALEARPKSKARSGRETAFHGPDAVCPATSLQSRARGWTQPLLLSAMCQYEWHQGSHVRSPCYECRRVAA